MAQRVHEAIEVLINRHAAILESAPADQHYRFIHAPSSTSKGHHVIAGTLHGLISLASTLKAVAETASPDPTSSPNSIDAPYSGVGILDNKLEVLFKVAFLVSAARDLAARHGNGEVNKGHVMAHLYEQFCEQSMICQNMVVRRGSVRTMIVWWTPGLKVIENVGK